MLDTALLQNFHHAAFVRVSELTSNTLTENSPDKLISISCGDFFFGFSLIVFI